MYGNVETNGLNASSNRNNNNKHNYRTRITATTNAKNKFKKMSKHSAMTWHGIDIDCRSISKSSTTQKSVIKWKIIIISSIILLLCRTSHVFGMRKGRLMSPSTFTALSGDLHVQIQFSGEEITNTAGSFTTTTHPTTITTSGLGNRSGNHLNGDTARHQTNVENTIMSTLVISKFIDEIVTEQAPQYIAKSNNNLSSNSSGGNSATQEQDQLLQRKRKEVVQNIPLFPDPRHNVTQISVPCQTFLHGGLYEMQVVSNLKTTATLPTNGSSTVTPTVTTTTLMPTNDERLRQMLDVRWPSAEMIVSPVRLRTYPENPVEVTLRFPEVNCERALRAQDLPEFWLELIYCGKERSCTQLLPQNITKSNILYAEQIRGFPKQKKLKLNCDLFGLAGNYAVQLRPMVPAPNVPITRRFLSVDWSDKFVFNVYARSIFPCDPHTGIGVLYEYPNCILEQGDRVRVYAKLRADVASLKPPTSLHYVAEQRVVKSQYSLYFNCELFTEKFVEYCFVYVSQAISGAVADVRMDCVPTLPVSDSDTGGWGPWSEWTPCSTNCLGGTRNRYRFCDTPPPRYGAKFCEGPSVETEKCGKTMPDSWDCIYETSGNSLHTSNHTDLSEDIGPGCRCGCIVHLDASKPKRIIAGATQSCPGRSFWLIQVDGNETISINMNFMRLPCTSQYIKIRDGPSLSSTLITELNGGVVGTVGGNNQLIDSTYVESSGAQLLVEFFAGEEVTAAAENLSSLTAVKSAISALNAATCTGGFMANVEQIVPRNGSGGAATLIAATRLSVKSRAVLQKIPKLHTRFTIVHLSAVIFASIIILISALLGAQYVVRYRKYHLAVARRREEGSRLHTPHASLSSLHSPPSRAVSTTTLLSEVIYMVKMRPKHQLRHSILRESVDAENMARETEFNEIGSREQMVKCDEEEGEFRGSTGSVLTLRNEMTSPASGSMSHTPSSEELAATKTDIAEPSTCSGTVTTKSCTKDTESIISSGMSSLCNSPPMNITRFSKYSDRYDALTLKIRKSRLEDSMQDCSSLRSGSIRLSLGARSASASLTNGCYSPAASVVSTATIRTTNPKESKEKQNRKKLLARPGSEFSLGNQEELELDYYDYNVINAGAAPGSYLGMDPAYLIWIPPFEGATEGLESDDDDKTPEPTAASDAEIHEPMYEEIKMPKYGHYLSPHSNTESTKSNTVDTTPTSDELSPLNSNNQSKITTPSEINQKNCFIQRVISSVSSISNSNSNKPPTPYMTRKQRRQAKHQSLSTLSLGNAKETTPMLELSGTKSAREITRTRIDDDTEVTTPIGNSPLTDSMTGSYVEKETTVVKSPSDLQGFLALGDIQYADAESESDQDAIKTKPKNEFTAKIDKLNDLSRVPRKSREFAV